MKELKANCLDELVKELNMERRIVVNQRTGEKKKTDWEFYKQEGWNSLMIWVDDDVPLNPFFALRVNEKQFATTVCSISTHSFHLFKMNLEYINENIIKFF